MMFKVPPLPRQHNEFNFTAAGYLAAAAILFLDYACAALPAPVAGHTGDATTTPVAVEMQAKQAEILYLDYSGTTLPALLAGHIGDTRKTPVAAKPAAKQAATLSERQAIYVLRTAMKSLHDAFQTGNFTVFRDLAGPTLLSRYTAAQLGEHYARIRASKIDLASATLMAPKVTRAARIDGSDTVRVDGSIGTGPEQLNFSIIVEPQRGRWTYADIAINRAQGVADISDVRHLASAVRTPTP